MLTRANQKAAKSRGTRYRCDMRNLKISFAAKYRRDLLWNLRCKRKHGHRTIKLKVWIKVHSVRGSRDHFAKRVVQLIALCRRKWDQKSLYFRSSSVKRFHCQNFDWCVGFMRFNDALRKVAQNRCSCRQKWQLKIVFPSVNGWNYSHAITFGTL